MSLESQVGGPDQQISVGSLGHAAPPPPRFNPTRGLEEAEWLEMYGALDHYREESLWPSFAAHVQSLKTLGAPWNVRISPEDRSRMADALDKYGEEHDWEYFLSLAASLSEIDPAIRPDAADVRAAESYVIKRGEEMMSNDLFVEALVSMMANLRRVGGAPDLSVQAAWRRHLNQRMQEHRGSRWPDFLSAAADLKLLDPSYDPALTEAELEQIREMLDTLRRVPAWGVFAHTAAAIKTLLPAPSIVPDAPPQPADRKFS